MAEPHDDACKECEINPVAEVTWWTRRAKHWTYPACKTHVQPYLEQAPMDGHYEVKWLAD